MIAILACNARATRKPGASASLGVTASRSQRQPETCFRTTHTDRPSAPAKCHGAGFRRRYEEPHGLARGRNARARGRKRRRLMTTLLPLGYKPLNRSVMRRYASPTANRPGRFRWQADGGSFSHLSPQTPADLAAIEKLDERAFGPGRFARSGCAKGASRTTPCPSSRGSAPCLSAPTG